jgi:hypothetical protein
MLERLQITDLYQKQAFSVILVHLQEALKYRNAGGVILVTS